MFAYIACVTEIAVAADAFLAGAALIANLLVCAVFALFSALLTEICTFRTPLSACAQILRAVFTQKACSAEVAVAADAGEADPALLA